MLYNLEEIGDYMKNNKLKIYVIGIVLTITDFIVKFIIDNNMKLNESIIIIPKFFKLYYLRNDGAAFSSFSGMKYLLIAISVIVFIYLIKYINKNDIKNKLEIISLGLILGGLFGNLIDRILYGEVIDYLSFTFFEYSFAVFNIADIGITVGVILFIINVLKNNN